MAKASHVIDLPDGKSFTVRLGWNAIRRVEEIQQCSIQEVGFRMVAGQSGLRELGVIFWAGLETARVHDKTRGNPYSLEEVGDLIDDIGSEIFFDLVYPQILIAFADAFPKAVKAAEEKTGKKIADPRQAVQEDSTGTPSSASQPNTD
jgi:hypothetical protein